jgi:hypothetical protein
MSSLLSLMLHFRHSRLTESLCTYSPTLSNLSVTKTKSEDQRQHATEDALHHLVFVTKSGTTRRQIGMHT